MKASLYAIDNPQFQCEKCLTQYAGRADSKSMTLKRRRMKGCFRPKAKRKPVHAIDNGEIEFYSCPGNFYLNTIGDYLEMHQSYTKGVLPYPGALSDQPSKVFQIFNVIERFKQAKMEAEEKKQRAKINTQRPTRMAGLRRGK